MIYFNVREKALAFALFSLFGSSWTLAHHQDEDDAMKVVHLDEVSVKSTRAN